MGIPFVQMALIGILPSALKIAYYRGRGAKIGKNVRIGLLTVLISNEIEIGDDCRIGMLTFIKVRRLRLGNRVRVGTLVAVDTGILSIGHDSVLMEQTVVGGMLTPRSSLSIGSRVKIFPYCFLNPTEPITIEDDVGVGGDTYLFTHGSWQSVLDGFPVGFGPINIRRGVWLPWRVFILPNVDIGEYATIAAGAVITRSIPANSLAAGMPAKVISENGSYRKTLSDDDKWAKVISIVKEMREFLEYEGAKTVIVYEALDALSIRVRMPHNESTDVIIQRDYIRSASGSIVVVMHSISLRQIEELKADDVCWFDIEAGVANPGPATIADQIKNYFSRYGIRFRVVTDPEFVPLVGNEVR